MLNQVNQRFKFDIKLRFYMEGKSGLNFKRFFQLEKVLTLGIEM